jgi:hypothetical protein
VNAAQEEFRHISNLHGRMHEKDPFFSEFPAIRNLLPLGPAYNSARAEKAEKVMEPVVKQARSRKYIRYHISYEAS